MALKDEFEDRIPLQRRIELTNPDDPDAGAQNDTLLDKVILDVQADFETFGVGVYDNTDARHVSAAIEGIEVKLQVYKGDSPSRQRHKDWQSMLENKLRLVTNNNRILPKSSSRLTPAEEAPGGLQVRPSFDGEESFEDLIPGQSPRIDEHGRF